MAHLRLARTRRFCALERARESARDECDAGEQAGGAAASAAASGAASSAAASATQDPPPPEEDLNAAAFSFLGGMMAASMFDVDAAVAEADEAADGADSGANESTASLLRRCASGDLAAKLGDADYWKQFDGAHEAGKGAGKGVSALPCDVPEAQRQLDVRGYYAATDGDVDDAAVWLRCAATVRAVEAAGWPPVCALLCNAPWQGVLRSWALARTLLGDEACVLEPSLFVWSLRRNDPAKALQKAQALAEATALAKANDGGYGGDGSEAKRCDRVGDSFGLPHRDFKYGDAHWPDGKAKVLTVWLPFTESNPDTGCLWVVPKEFDEVYSDEGHYDHLRPALPGFEQGVTKLRFPIGCARPMTLAPGRPVCWHNLIHWGGVCGQDSEPRISVAATFRRSDAPPTHLAADGALDGVVFDFDRMAADAQSPSQSDRARLVAHALLMYSDWYEAEDALPKAFRELVGR